ncbi:reverse transcriptase domain-containing protein [Tanacetum coccineum]
MRTRSQARKRQQQQVPPNLVEPPKDTMADNRTMAELLQAPTEGYEDAIVVPEIEAANFEIKHGLLTLVQNKQSNDDAECDLEKDILLLEAILNSEPLSPLPNHANYFPETFEYAFLEGDNKLPVIIAKDLSVLEKTALIKVLQSHKLAIAWKLSDIKGYFQIPIDPNDQEKTTFTCPYGTFAYRRMPFGLCNAPGTFQRCMTAIFHDMIEKTMEYLHGFADMRNRTTSRKFRDHRDVQHQQKKIVQRREALFLKIPLCLKSCADPVRERGGKGETVGAKIVPLLGRNINNAHIWAFRTAYKTPIGLPPNTSVAGRQSSSDRKLELTKLTEAQKHTTFDIKTAVDHRKDQPDELK